MEPARARAVQKGAHQKSVASGETEITFTQGTCTGQANPHALATPEHGTGADASGSKRSTPRECCIQGDGDHFHPRNLHGASQPPKEHKRILTESFTWNRLQRGRMDLSFFLFWIVLRVQVLTIHQFDHSTKPIISNCNRSPNNTLS